MTTTPETTTRITCDIPHMLNDQGRHPKTLVEIEPDGIWVYCRTCKKAHFLERAIVVAAWENGVSAVQGCD